MDLAWDTMGAVIDGRYPLFAPVVDPSIGYIKEKSK